MEPTLAEKQENLLVFDNKHADHAEKGKSLQDNFKRFLKTRKNVKKQRQYMANNEISGRDDPVRMQMLREKFIETAKKYMGVPYAKRYHKPGEPLYDSPIFLDCCALIRQTVADLQEDFGFRLARWNQAYQWDTLPNEIPLEEMKPGDLVFYTATYFNARAKKQRHDMVHVEIFLGGPTGEQSLGARWQRGVVQVFDSYKFKSTSYYDIKFYYKSIDTWLKGICKSWCDVHPWRDPNLSSWTPKNSIFSEDGLNDEDLCNAEGAGEDPDAESQVLDQDDKKTEEENFNEVCYIGPGNNNRIVRDALIMRGFKELPKEYKFSSKFRFRWVQTHGEINYHEFIEDKNIVNHIPNNSVISTKTGLLETMETLEFMIDSGKFETSLKVADFFPYTLRFDRVSDAWKFLKSPDDHKWIVKPKGANQGRGIYFIDDAKAFKHELLHGSEQTTKTNPNSENIPPSDESTSSTTEKQPSNDTSSSSSSSEALQETTQKNDDSPSESTTTEEKQLKEEMRRTYELKEQVKKHHNNIFQRYMESPLLIKGRKFDYRVFMLVASCEPYLVLFSDGYFRLSLEPYTLANFSEGKSAKTTHLTNAAVQKKHPDFKEKKEDTIWNLEQFADYMTACRGANNEGENFSAEDVERAHKRIRQICLLVFKTCKPKLRGRFGFFDLFGLDFLFDENLNPFLLEVNTNPALFTDTKVQKELLPTLVDNTIDIVLKLHKDKQTCQECVAEISKSSHGLDVLYNEVTGEEFDLSG
eukprot:CAMPEP_0115017808 /NCGR_PEP_ID=MMETSP0216-20121206/28364_1 /TAXON_ID=223996 /ORGANISM="Protocruzia adherens, Strain Boccale" /LENGTH=753 /DNA_ID=CAMNT_0002388749 /DNA_START=129 /DNA_END=2390 /DNA_ORIENTATION=+